MSKYLTIGKYSTLLDDDIYEKLKDKKWMIDIVKNRNNTKRVRETKTGIYLHRYIFDNFDPKIVIDHINRNTLDNRRSNLRICTTQQNCINRPMQINNTTGFKGVYLRENKRSYRACIRYNQKLIHLGTFKTAEEAALAYNTAALEYFGEFAWLNKITMPNGKEN